MDQYNTHCKSKERPWFGLQFWEGDHSGSFQEEVLYKVGFGEMRRVALVKARR